jgi:hypothetical protein
MPRLNPTAGFIAVAATAWISQATLALTDAGTATDRVALIAVSWPAIGIAICAGGIAAVAVRRGLRLVALAPLVLCLLPYLPVSVPPAFLLWSGPLVWLPWAGVAATALASVPRRHKWSIRRPQVAAGTTAAIVFVIAAWSVAPSLPGGDEPHYLIITQSLINDRDLRIEDNHQRGEYREYFAGELRPDFLRRGRDGQIYSIHAPGLPALIAPAFVLGGYRGVVVLLIVLSALGSALAWHLAWLRTGRADAAWFGWASVTLCVTTVFHSFSVYPDGLGGVLILTGVWALFRGAALSRLPNSQGGMLPWLLHGAALALLPWLHSRFALLAGTLGALILLRLWSTPDRLRKVAAFVAIPIVSGVGWIGYFVAIYGVADPAAPYGGGDLGSVAYIADGLAGLFFDQRFGLLTYAPVLVFAIAGFAVMRNRLAIELLFVIVPYLLVVTNFRMWWAGWSAPARFAVPVLLLLAIPAAEAWSAIRRRGTRATAAGALLLTVLATCVLVFVDSGGLAYNVRTDYALWITWAARNADLASALPAWALRQAELFREIAIWCVAMLTAWALVRGADGHPALRGRAALASATAGVFAIAAMAAATIVWESRRDDGLLPVPAQMEFLRHAATERHAVRIGLQPLRRIERSALPRQLRIHPELVTVPEGPAGDAAPLFTVPTVPAGEYHLRARLRDAGGRLYIGIGRDPRPIDSGEADSTMTLRLPVDVTAVLIRGDDAARRNVRGLVIEPVSLVSPVDRLTDDFATAVMKYGETTVFFLDRSSFPEPEAFWVGGGRDASLVLAPATPSPSAPLLLRNAPVENRVMIQSDAWREELRLQPGEERRLDVPLDARRGSSLIRFTVSSGFRPSDIDATSADHRFLGVWVKLLDP